MPLLQFLPFAQRAKHSFREKFQENLLPQIDISPKSKTLVFIVETIPTIVKSTGTIVADAKPARIWQAVSLPLVVAVNTLD